ADPEQVGDGRAFARTGGPARRRGDSPSYGQLDPNRVTYPLTALTRIAYERTPADLLVHGG
ncbi:hypothetical protein, partial [Streptomyces sp. NPDC004579]|uniref:hypothetical protein n=1 Tax=Streptomyces sp. NPDC004579 TaxID=3154667 RepID=UPI0033B623FB